MMRELRVGLAASDWKKVHEVVSEASVNEQKLGDMVAERFPETKAGFLPHWKRQMDAASQKLQNVAAVRIQASYRGNSLRNQSAVRKIQLAWHAHVVNSQVQAMLICFRKAKNATVNLQSTLRMRPLRTQFLDQTRSVRVLQASLRSAQLRHKHKTEHGAVTWQTMWRGFSARAQIIQANAAATVIQSSFRSNQEIYRYAVARRAAIHLQSAVRGRLGRLATLETQMVQALDTQAYLKSELQGQSNVMGLERGIRTAGRLQPRNQNLQKLVATGQVVKGMRVAMKRSSVGEMANILESVSQGQMVALAAKEMVQALDELENTVMPEQLVDALSTGKVGAADDGDLDMTSAETSQLEKVCHDVQRMEPTLPRVQQLLRSAQIILRLRESLLCGRWDAVNDLLRCNSDESVEHEGRSELYIVRSAVALRQCRLSLQRAAREGRVTETNGFPDCSGVKTSALSKALQMAGTAGELRECARQELEAAQLLLGLRQALQMGKLQRVQDLLEGHTVEQTSEYARLEVGIILKTLPRERTAQAILRQIDDARRQSHEGSLTTALKVAADLQLVTHPSQHVRAKLQAAQQVALQLSQSRHNLEVSVRSGDQSALDEAMMQATRLGMDNQQMAAAKSTSNHLQTLQQRAQHAYERLDSTELERILVEAQENSLTLPNERELKGIILMPEENLLVLKLERYRQGQASDIDPSVVSKRLLELGYEADPHRFSLEKCTILSPAAKAAAAQFKLRSSTQSELPFVLTINVAMELAQGCFSKIQSYLHRTAGWEDNALSLVSSGSSNFGQGDEILCQLIMQLMGNDSVDRMNRAWQLMSMCLKSFLPSQQFVNYLDSFLRHENEETCLSLLHRGLQSANQSLPTAEDVTLVASKRFFSSTLIDMYYDSSAS
jgi:hypothetical protein